MASDFHTHHTPAPGIKALISVVNPVSGYFNSRQFHPWHLPETFSPPELDFKEFHAIGEVGLDKLRGPQLPIQLEYLRFFLGAAQDMQLPVVLHIVRCYQELFEVIKPFNLRLMVHGFCGSSELLKELWKRNITVSFNCNILQRRELLAELQKTDKPFGFESDDNENVSIPELLAQTGIKDIEAVTDRNFNDFIYGTA